VVSKTGSGLQRARDLALRWLAPGQVHAQWNEWNLYREIAWFGVLSGVSNTFISVFALRLGASNLLMGLRTSLPALVNVIFQIPAARLVERASDTRKVLLLSGLLMRLPVFIVALAPLFPERMRAGAVIYITALGTIPAAVGTVSFTAMFADVIAPPDRARVVSLRNALLAAATMLTVLMTGQALDLLPFPGGYQLVFALSFAASLVSLYYLGRLAIPESDATRPNPAPSGERLGVRRSVRRVLAQRDYLRFALGSFLYHWGLYFPVPLYAIYRVRTLGISEGWIGALSTLESAVTIVVYYALGKVAQRRGSRSVLLLGILLVCFFPIGTALSTSPWPLLLVSFVAGIANPAFNLGLFNTLLEFAPTERRASYVALFNTLMNVAAFASPLLGTTVAEWIGIREALWIGGLARIAGFLAFAYLLSGSPAPRRIVHSLGS
jgi:MFS family permease